jgi:hypothetical protein
MTSTGVFDVGAQPSPIAESILSRIRAVRASANDPAARIRRPDGTLEAIWPEDIVAAVEVEWRAGLRSVSRMARDFGMTRQSIEYMAKSRGWPSRASTAAATRQAVNEAVIERAVNMTRLAAASSRLTAAAAGNPDGDPLAGIVSPEARGDVLMADYAQSVACVVEGMRDASRIAVGVGRTLLDEYRQAIEAAIAETRTDVRAGKVKPHDATLALVGKQAAIFKTLVQAVRDAHQLQRQAYGLDAMAPDGNPPPGDMAPGSYEDAVREAEAKGVRLT